ncbi:hypothetical protein G6F62_004591 [Rhizopus arrhizus]|nr:hypothetical protein G6F62_004591 [Rhizopus arrhizus]
MNNNNNNSSTFTWVLDTNYFSLDNNTIDNDPNAIDVSNDDLFQFLLEPQIQQQQLLNSTTYNNSSNSSDGSTSSGEEGFMNHKLKSTSSDHGKHSSEFASSTGRLDFRQVQDNLSESQLKLMTSKERRQLRNKISARNFRNRRKEYVTTLETELEQQKAENSQLKLEIKWLKSKMEKLQGENDKLRLDLVLGPVTLPSSQQQLVLHPSPDMSLLSTTPPSQDDNWDFILPDFNSEQHQNTFISQAVVPTWNQVFLSKEQEQREPSVDLLKQYPLLAPALMSIILSHTMTMNTDQLIASAKFSNSFIQQQQQQQQYLIPSSPNMTNKEAQTIWNLLEPLRVVKERNEKLAEKSDDKDDDQTKDDHKKEDKIICPITRCVIAWLQYTVCGHISKMIAKCNDTPIEEKPLLCRSYQRAMKYIYA